MEIYEFGNCKATIFPCTSKGSKRTWAWTFTNLDGNTIRMNFRKTRKIAWEELCNHVTLYLREEIVGMLVFLWEHFPESLDLDLKEEWHQRTVKFSSSSSICPNSEDLAWFLMRMEYPQIAQDNALADVVLYLEKALAAAERYQELVFTIR